MLRLTNKDAFAVYRLPREDNYQMVRCSGDDILAFEDFDPSNTGFVFHPFKESDKCPALVLPADELAINPKFSFSCDQSGHPFVIDERSYVPLVSNFVDHIRMGDFHKAISSRIITKEKPLEDLFPLFIKLKNQYPFAFVYLVNIPGVGCWMGATPEILLTAQNGIGETVALAGTRPLTSTEDWGRKEILEQQMVERYMADILIKRKKNFSKTGPFTVNAGNVMHLKTRFRFPMSSSWKAVAMDIHPSPAVCGLPKQKAMDFIIDTEPHHREYYCGFLGPVNLDGQTHLYVNLRCMQVFKDKFALYVGGGITADSVPEKELEETRWKSRTLSDIIEEVYREPEFIG